MKKILTFFLTALLAFSVGWAAETYSHTFKSTDSWSSQIPQTVTLSSIEWTLDGTCSNGLYLGNIDGTKGKQFGSGSKPFSELSLSTTGISGTITSITVNASTASGASATLSVTVGGTSFINRTLTTTATDYTGTGSASGEVVISITQSTSKALYIKSISITFTPGGGTTVAAPTITPNGGEFLTSQEVTLSAEDGASIYYTTDGNDPTTSSTQYSAPFTINATTTVKAIAVKNNVPSSVASATFTMLPSVATVAAANQLGTGTKFGFTGNAVVTYQNGNNLWIRDNTGSGLIYGNVSNTYQAIGTNGNGDILDVNWIATKTEYNGLSEFGSPSGVATSSNGGTVAPEQLSTLTTGDANKYVSLNNVTITGSSTSNNNVTNYTVNGASYILRNQFGLVTLTEGKTYNVVGVVSIYNDELQLFLISAEEVASTTPTILVNPATLTINDSGSDNTFTVEGSNLGGDNVGLTQSGSYFTPTLLASIGWATNGGSFWYFTPDNGSVSGTVAMNYTGRELSASETVTLGNNSGASATVTVNYVPDLYIVTDNGVTGDWHFDGTYGVEMANNNGVYTGIFTANNPNTFILFARKIGDGVNWNTRYVFGPNSEGDWVLQSDDADGTLDLYHDHPIEFPQAGTYVITINANAGTFTITKQSTGEGDGSFTLVTNASDLNAGDEIIFVSSGSAGSANAMSTTQATNNRLGTEVTVSNGLQVTATDATQIFTLEGSSDGWYFHTVNGDNQGYIYASSSSSNQLKTKATADDNAKATISLASDGVATIDFQGTNSRNRMRYNPNNGSPIFACYASNSTTGTLPYIYKRAGASVSAPVISPPGGTNNKRYESVDVTITAASGCTIYYTTDGSTPTQSSTQYTGTFTLPYGSAPTTVKAIAVDGDGHVSNVATMVYYWNRVNVSITPATKSVTEPTTIDAAISVTPADATVTYTINDGQPQAWDGEHISVTVDENNPHVVIEVTAVKGESTGTATATYSFKRDHVNSVAEFMDLDDDEEVTFSNSVVVLFDYSQNSGNNTQDYVWVKDRTGFMKLFIRPAFDPTNNKPRYENGDVIPPGFKVTKKYYVDSDGSAGFYEGSSTDNSLENFALANEKALADPENVKLSELIANGADYNDRYLYISKIKVTERFGTNGHDFYVTADEDGNTIAEVGDNTKVVGYDKYVDWKDKQGNIIGVNYPEDITKFYNVTCIFQKYGDTYEIMPIRFTEWEDNSLRLDELVEVGVVNNEYTISNQLKAAKVTWDDNYGKFAIFAKDDEMYANKRYPANGMDNYLIEYVNNDSTFFYNVEQEDYDQSNWIEILIPNNSNVTSKSDNEYESELGALQSTYENKILKAGEVTGIYKDDLNPTIEMSELPQVESSSTYEPNYYCTANFLQENLDTDGAQSHRTDELAGGSYFMMDAKPQEFCKVVWAYYTGSGDVFVAPEREGDLVNGLRFHGSFKANMSLCEDKGVTAERTVSDCFAASSATNPAVLYGFNAIVRKNPAYNATPASGAPSRIQPYTDGIESTPAYIVYPLNAGTTSDGNVTEVNEVVSGKTVESVRFYNLMGVESDRPFEGVNIVVTRYTDGSRSTVKVLR